MAGTEVDFATERLSANDATAGLALSREAGWNQTREDWQLFFERGIVFGIRDDEGRVIATAALLPSPPLTWISMVLVTVEWRRRGLADRLMRRCLAEAQSQGWQPWLDATPAGAAVYRTLGFAETGFSIRRMRRPADTTKTALQTYAGNEEPQPDLAALLDADRHAMGFDRGGMVQTLTERSGSNIYRNVDALALVRDGDRARHIGPVCADDEDATIVVLDHIVTADVAPLLIDVAGDRLKLRRWCEDQGFVFERPFARMCLGAPGNIAKHDRLMAVAGPEFG